MKNRDAMFALRVLGRIQEFTIDAPILGRSLAMEFNTTVRHIADTVALLQDAGHKIGASKSEPMGYFKARTPEELHPTIVRLRETAKKIFIKTNRMADWNQKEPTIFEQQYQVDEQIGNYLQ